MLEIGKLAIEGELREKERVHGKSRDQASIDSLKTIVALLPKLDLPSSFILHVADGSSICGTLKDSGLEESITSYYFKHGTHGIADIWILGIKEISSAPFGFVTNDFLNATRNAATFLNSMLFPAESSKATPIALFRKLGPKQS
jgi:hypothetical protein